LEFLRKFRATALKSLHVAPITSNTVSSKDLSLPQDLFNFGTHIYPVFDSGLNDLRKCLILSKSTATSIHSLNNPLFIKLSLILSGEKIFFWIYKILIGYIFISLEAIFVEVMTAATCSHWFLARGFFYPEDGGDTFLRNVGSFHRIYTTPHPRRRHSSFNYLVYVRI
jgi:hypothetical protein